MTESPMLAAILKGEWGWDGLVMSDWFATRDAVGAGTAAMDLAMPGPASPFVGDLAAAVRDGRVPEAALDAKIAAILRLSERVGAGAPAAWGDDDVAGELRACAAASFVLARNEGDLLPLAPATLERVAVLGPNAAVARTLGGGSATVFPPYTVSPLDGLRAALGDADVTHSPGVRAHERIPLVRPEQLVSLQSRLLDAGGAVLAAEDRRGGALAWQGTLPDGARTLEIHARVRAEATGEHVIGCSGTGRFTLAVAGEERFDAELALPPGADLAEAHMRPPQRGAPVTLEAGQEVDVVVRHVLPDAPFLAVQLNVDVPHRPDAEELERATALAADADVAIVVVGTNEEVECEGFDRDSLALPGLQDELVRRVAAANPRTVVVVNAGAPVLLPWAGDVPAVLLTWFPGQEAGNALADVLLGASEPGGRLPTTWPASDAGLPSTRPADGVLRYDEDLLIGYRSPDRDALFAFGHGLGYTSWEYVGIEAYGDTVRVRVRNAGDRAGREVVQLYAARDESAVTRPRRWLVGFAGVEAGPGEEAEVEIAVPERALAHWDVAAHAFVVEPGAFDLSAGRSCVDLRVATSVDR
jgi:beta-glucosidase